MRLILNIISCPKTRLIIILVIDWNLKDKKHKKIPNKIKTNPVKI